MHVLRFQKEHAEVNEQYQGPTAFIDLFNAEDNNTIACYRIPAMVTAPNGDLLVAIDERVPSCGDLKWSKDINIVMRRSTIMVTLGTEIERIVDNPLGQSASDPSMIVDEVTKEVFLFYNYMDLEKERDAYYLRFVKSSDNGKTWSSPIDITSQIAKPEWHKDFKFITSGRGIQTSTGILLHTWLIWIAACTYLPVMITGRHGISRHSYQAC